MKILNIFFKNINSLEGEGRVYFDQGPIADSGVFAITGPNGSGKSSILDVITLGLYGETFRFDKPASHVMTKQTNECFAQVEFALGDDRYRSSWEVRTSEALSESTPLLPKMTLTRLNGVEEVLAETPNQVRSRITELTGMDFHRFSKTIVLPQGDFSAFLNALDSERMDILEKISGTDLYAEYRQRTEARFNQAQTRLKQLQQDIATVPILSQAELESVEQDLHDFEEQVAEYKQRQSVFQRKLNGFRHLSELQAKQLSMQNRRGSLGRQVEEYQGQLQRIAEGQLAAKYRAEVNLLDSKQVRVAENQAVLESYRRELAMLQQQLGSGEQLADVVVSSKSLGEQKQAIDALKLTLSELKLELPRQRELAQSLQKQYGDNQAAIGEINIWFQAHANDAILVEDFPNVVRLRQLRSELADLSRKRKSQDTWIKNTTNSLRKSKNALQTAVEDLAELKAQLEADHRAIETIADGRSFEDLTELQQEQQARVADFHELLSLASVTAKLRNRGILSWLGFGAKTDTPPDIVKLQAELDGLVQELSREENIIKVLEQAVRNEALVKKMAADRLKLVDGKPCYLCGSISHPYVLKPPVFTDAKKALVDQRGKILSIKSRIDNATNQLKTAQKFDFRISAKRQRLQQMHSQWTVLANKLNIMRDGMGIDNLSLLKRLLIQESDELDKLNALVKQHAQLQRSIVKKTADIDSRQAAAEKLTETVRQLEAQWENRPPEFDELERYFNACVSEEKALVEKLEKQLAGLGEKMPGKGKENALFDRLNSRRQDYQVYQMRQAGLQKEVDALRQQLEVCENKIRHYETQIAADTEQLSKQEHLGLHIAIIEKQKLIVDQEQQLRVSQIEHKTILQSLSDAISGAPFESVDMLRELLQLLDRESEIRLQLEIANTQIQEIEQQLQQLAFSIEAEAADLAEEHVTESVLQEQLDQVDRQLDIAEHEVRTLETKLAKQQQYQDKYLGLSQQIESELLVFSQAQAEMAVINDDPLGFRRQVQQIMADKLLSHTNGILEQLSGRYYVRSGSSEHGLALEIEDTKQKNLRRSPQTLSGGESFVLSLALALALAEIANNGKAIDSLFLDEGFGNLDGDSLYLAMTTLENLKTHGKTVGIISHVEGVKKRIKTQIELVKKPNGLSELKMVA